MANITLTNTSVFDGTNVYNSTGSSDVTVLTDAGDDILTVTVSPSATRIRSGKTLTYTITILNKDSSITANTISFTDTYSTTGYTVTDATSSGDVSLTLDRSTAGKVTANTFSLTHGQSVTITITGTVTNV